MSPTTYRDVIITIKDDANYNNGEPNVDCIKDYDGVNNEEIVPTVDLKKVYDDLRDNNEKSWREVLFYDPTNCDSDLDCWLVRNRPSIHINKSPNKSIVVLHPNLNVSEYKRANHREGMSVPEEVKEKIISERDEMDHERLLTAAFECYRFEGFWFLSCKDEPKDLVKLWDSYFIKIVRELCETTANVEEDENYLGFEEDESFEFGKEEHLKFVKIEARWNSSRNEGIIMIYNKSFLPDNRCKIAPIIKNLIHPLDAKNGCVSRRLSYKPLFYLISGMDPHFSHQSNVNIYHQDLTTNQYQGTHLNEMAKNWFLDHDLLLA